MREDIFRIRNGSRIQRGITVLENIQMELRSGVIQGVFFENRDEEKSFIQVLCGEAIFTGGRIYYREEYCGPEEAAKLFRQEVFVPRFCNKWSEELTVTDFFCLYKNSLLKRRRETERKIQTYAEAFELEICPDDRMRNLPTVQRIKLELIRALERGYSVIVLRGITSGLDKQACASLMKLIEMLRHRGLTFLLLDHEEVLAGCCTAEIYAVSHGCTVFVYRPEELQERLRKRLSAGGMPLQDTVWNGEVLRIRGIETEAGVKLDVSVYNGETVILLDTKGTEIQRLAGILKGEITYREGNIWLKGTPFSPGGIQDVIRFGVGMIEEREGSVRQDLFYNLTGIENLELLMAEKKTGWTVRKNYRRSIIRESEPFFSEAELNTRVMELQPWQQQRLAYYRWYLYYPQLMICVRPLSGLDVQMRREAEQMIQKMRERGIAVLVLTSSAAVAGRIRGKIINI